ncbi:response regulator [Candidatus Saccharibacteria bacterium]|nr:response regulator [Candidatus Saccharibacteria bacterium]
MTKIMLVEDDKSLREIYSIRLVAEGYEVVSAGDGEEALALAVQQRPDLIVSDVMMPKISGFDMLDILRSTPETKDIKVIMMTALSSEDQRQRGESLGADKYLVKSQVGIEDVVNAVHEVLGDKAASNTASATNATTSPSASAPTVPSQPMGAQPSIPKAATTEAPAPEAATQVAAPTEASAAPETPAVETQAAAPETTPAEAIPAPAPEAAPANSTSAAMDELLNNTPDTNHATWPGNTSQ